VIDFALEMALSGMSSCREAKALAETAKIGADVYLAEKQLSAHLVDEEGDHPLGEHGGVAKVPLDPSQDISPVEIGYDTTVPAPEPQETREAFVLANQPGGDRAAMTGHKMSNYPREQDGTKNPAPERRYDVNKKVAKVARDVDDEIKI
jgi:hypothetical protein